MQALAQASHATGGKGTWVERMIAHIRENPWVAAAIALATSIVAVVGYAEKIKDLLAPLFINRKEAARVTLARLSLEFTSDAFVQSAERADIHAVEAFLEAGIDCNRRNRAGDNALSFAVRRGDTRMVRALLKAGADISTKDRELWTALDRAVVGGKGVMDLLLATDPKPELIDSGFVHAAMYGTTEMLRGLAKHGANVKQVGPKALTMAARFCREEKRQCENIAYLLERGIDPNSRDEEGCTPLHSVALYGAPSSLRVLLDHGADVNARVGHQYYLGGSTALLIAAGQGSREAVEILLARGAEIGVRDKHGSTAMILAIRASHEEQVDAEIVEVLLRAGAVIDARDDAGRTALVWAVQTGRLLIMRNLLDLEADVNLHDNQGCTALMASSSEKPEMAKILLERGADIKAADHEGRTALMFAAEWGRLAIVQLFLDNRADVNACDATGKTALMYAAERGNPNTIRVLLERGAQVNKKERDGRTALQFAEDYDSDGKIKAEMVRVLTAAGAKLG